ncbi:MAG TPA: hypothetical protein VHF22_08090, partial [Planctomycetota bacterium]|nr:hypothetical protein [Planctomycetota bacterium]
MREGPLAELFKATEAAQRQGERTLSPLAEDAPTVEAAYPLEEEPQADEPPSQAPAPEPEPPLVARPSSSSTSPPRAAASGAARVAEAIAPKPVEAPRLTRAPRPDNAAYLAVIRVVGVGGGGLNAVNRMIEAGISQVEFIGMNTDIQQLRMSEAPVKLHLGRELTQGLGSGA